MSVIDSLLVGLFGMTVVFIVLLGLSLLIRLQAALVSRFAVQKAGKAALVDAAAAIGGTHAESNGDIEPLMLTGVDEKTAAMIMAIVCDEIQANPDELQFKSITAMTEDH